ncbi:MAG TPA: sulfurtransferase [Candidatus Nanopelagicales bacterium]|nr:sulfurtransferase [Candidatus Nanopelagicales bacterium]
MSLITAAELATHLDGPDLRIADVRWSLAAPAAGRAAYGEAHLPGAVFIDLDTVLTAPAGPGRHPLPDPAAFAAAIGALGIGREHRVVAYDDVGGTVAARLWWMLDVLGHTRAAVLDGGIAAWRAAGLPLTGEVPSHAPAGPWPDLPAAWPQTIPREGLAARLGALTLLDARAPERYRGEIEPIDPVAGHIPTAVNAPTGSFLAPDGHFLAPGALAARFVALGAAGERPVVVACGSGVNACQLALAMRTAGLPDPLLYPGSYSDWSRSGMPVATGSAPGGLPGANDRPA